MRSQCSIEEEQLLLSLCGKPYAAMIQGAIPMTVNDYNRFCYVIIQLEFYCFYSDFISRFSALAQQATEMERIHENVVRSKYPVDLNSYADYDKSSVWLKEFWNQIPSEQKQEQYREQFWMDDPVGLDFEGSDTV